MLGERGNFLESKSLFIDFRFLHDENLFYWDFINKKFILFHIFLFSKYALKVLVQSILLTTLSRGLIITATGDNF